MIYVREQITAKHLLLHFFLTGRTALHIACEMGWAAGARVLCDHGASIVKQDGTLQCALPTDRRMVS